MANPLLVLMILLGFFPFPLQSKVVEDEVVALQDIVQTMGARYWKFDDVSCQVEMVGVTPHAPLDAESDIKCDCQFENNTCHVVRIWLKRYSLPGVLPRELVKLPYLREVDFAYNYLSGGIPLEWASLQLESISLLVNRLSGEIPKELGGITSLIALYVSVLLPSTTLNLEANQFTGRVPDELGKLMNLKTFRISDNNFGGVIPDYIQNWRQLNRLELHASGLHGPIPSVISLLDGLADLRISDIDGPTQEFPNLSNMTDSLVRLVLRNCNIAGEIPEYLWTMKNVKMLGQSYWTASAFIRLEQVSVVSVE
ncbi:putative LRR receptor-like serine/threonine-protein kinase RFK1 [Bienertia sinuspersici]